MGADFLIARATWEHATHLAAHMRPLDVDECLASGHATPLDAVLSGMDRGHSVALFLGGELAAIYGVVCVKDAPTPFFLWALTTDAVDRHRKSFFKASKWVVERLRGLGPLFTLVDARHHLSLRWLARLGFKVSEPQPHPASGLLFHLVTIGGL